MLPSARLASRLAKHNYSALRPDENPGSQQQSETERNDQVVAQRGRLIMAQPHAALKRLEAGFAANAGLAATMGVATVATGGVALALGAAAATIGAVVCGVGVVAVELPGVPDATHDSLTKLFDLAKEHRGLEVGDNTGWRALGATSSPSVRFAAPDSGSFVKIRSLKAALMHIAPPDEVEFNSSASATSARLSSWAMHDKDAAMQKSIEFLKKEWSICPILRELDQQVQEYMKTPSKPASTSDAGGQRTHIAVIYKVTLVADGAGRFRGRSYYGQAVRKGYPSSLTVAKKRWSEHLRDSIKHPKDAGFHYLLRLYPDHTDWQWELVASCRHTADGECETVWHQGCVGLYCDDSSPTAHLVDPKKAYSWADKLERAKIDEDGGPWGEKTNTLDAPTTFNLTAGGQGDPFIRFTSMLVRSELGYERFLTIWRDFKEKNHRAPTCKDTHTYKGATYKIGLQQIFIRTRGDFMRGYPDRIVQLTAEGFIWNEHNAKAARFMEAFALYVKQVMAATGAAWNGKPPIKTTTVELDDGVIYPLGRNMDAVTHQAIYIRRDPEVLSFLIALGLKSKPIYTKWCSGVWAGKLVTHDEAQKLLEQ